jgi:hypothetical protein
VTRPPAPEPANEWASIPNAREMRFTAGDKYPAGAVGPSLIPP